MSLLKSLGGRWWELIEQDGWTRTIQYSTWQCWIRQNRILVFVWLQEWWLINQHLSLALHSDEQDVLEELLAFITSHASASIFPSDDMHRELLEVWVLFTSSTDRTCKHLGIYVFLFDQALLLRNLPLCFWPNQRWPPCLHFHALFKHEKHKHQSAGVEAWGSLDRWSPPAPRSSWSFLLQLWQ